MLSHGKHQVFMTMAVELEKHTVSINKTSGMQAGSLPYLMTF